MIKRGFNVIEIVIAMAILLILSVIIIGSFLSFRDKQALSATASKTMSVVNEARIKTISSKNSLQYSIFFESDKITMFEGTTFSSIDPNNIEFKFSSIIESYNISLNGGSDEMYFEKLTGTTDEFGSIGFRVKSDTTRTKTVNINANGIIDAD